MIWNKIRGGHRVFENMGNKMRTLVSVEHNLGRLTNFSLFNEENAQKLQPRYDRKTSDRKTTITSTDRQTNRKKDELTGMQKTDSRQIDR